MFGVGRTICAAAAAVIVVGTVGIVGTSPAGAALVAHGTVSCTNGGGPGKFTPPLMATGSGATVLIKFTGKMQCTSTSLPGTPSFTVASAAFTGKGTLLDPTSPAAANGCASFTNSDLIQAIKVKIHWPGAVPPIAPTVVTYTAGGIPLVSNNAGSDRLSMPSGAITTISGSFATDVNALIVLDTLIPNTCSASWGPFPTFTFGTTSILKIF